MRGVKSDATLSSSAFRGIYENREEKEKEREREREREKDREREKERKIEREREKRENVPCGKVECNEYKRTLTNKTNLPLCGTPRTRSAHRY